MENENTFRSKTEKAKHSDSGSNYHLGGIIEEILDCMHDGVYITDNNGITLFVNKSYTKMSGIRKDDVIGKHMEELIKKGFFLKSASLTVLKKKNSVSIIDCFKNGKKCLATSSPVFDRNGQVVMVVTNLRDMTELLDLKNGFVN